MDQPIVTIEHIKSMGRAAALRRDPRDSHCMNWFAPALPHWLEGYDSVSRASHAAPAGRARVELAQGVV
jgi:hypothetical protein